MTVSLNADDFELFGLPQRFAQDKAGLDTRWKELQREVHPDRFAAQGAAAQRAAMQWSVRVNEAYHRLKDPLRRAAYLCELRGASVEAERNTSMPPAFLQEQIEWREALEDADSEAALEAIRSRLDAVRRDVLARTEYLLDVAKDAPAAAAQVRALMFIDRFAHDVESRIDRL